MSCLPSLNFSVRMGSCLPKCMRSAPVPSINRVSAHIRQDIGTNLTDLSQNTKNNLFRKPDHYQSLRLIPQLFAKGSKAIAEGTKQMVDEHLPQNHTKADHIEIGDTILRNIGRLITKEPNFLAGPMSAPIQHIAKTIFKATYEQARTLDPSLSRQELTTISMQAVTGGLISPAISKPLGDF
jgi:hypothetical protein